MTDSLGWRMKFAVIAPSTNTSVQPEYDEMRPFGVTNHFERIAIPDTKVTDDDSFMVMLNNIRNSTMESAIVAMSMDPGCLIMGMSAETFWDGADGAEKLQNKMEEKTNGVPVIMDLMPSMPRSQPTETSKRSASSRHMRPSATPM